MFAVIIRLVPGFLLIERTHLSCFWCSWTRSPLKLFIIQIKLTAILIFWNINYVSPFSAHIFRIKFYFIIFCGAQRVVEYYLFEYFTWKTIFVINKKFKLIWKMLNAFIKLWFFKWKINKNDLIAYLWFCEKGEVDDCFGASWFWIFFTNVK